MIGCPKNDIHSKPVNYNAGSKSSLINGESPSEKG
jgi:hypothetical protein